MNLCSLPEILALLHRGKPFAAMMQDRSFLVEVKDLVPFVAMAIHNGSAFRPELQEHCLLTPQERLYEEDPHTGEFIQDLPIRLVAMDSRYEYDLNRSIDQAIYEEAWGRQVWKTPLPEAERQLSLAKYTAFYQVVTALVEMLKEVFGQVLVFDVHAYNYRRHNCCTPTFSVDDFYLDQKRDRVILDHWVSRLQEIHLPGLKNQVEVTGFLGQGYLSQYLNQELKGCLALPTEVKKVYLDETTGEADHKRIQVIRWELSRQMFETADFFERQRVRSCNLI